MKSTYQKHFKRMKKSVIALMIATIFLSCQQAEEPTTESSKSSTTGQTNLATTKKMMNMIENKELESLMSHFTDSAIMAQPYSLNGPGFAYVGKGEVSTSLNRILGLMQSIAYEGSTFTISENGSTVIVETKGKMILAQNGQDYNNNYVFRVDFDDNGMVVKFTEYFNSLYLAKTFGLIPPTEE